MAPKKYKGWFRLAIATPPITGLVFAIPTIFGLKEIVLKKDFETGLVYYIPLSLVQIFAFIFGMIVNLVFIMVLALVAIHIIPWIKEGFNEGKKL